MTTTASVVFSTGVAGGVPLIRIFSMSGVNCGGKPRPPYSSPTSNGAAQNPRSVPDRHGADRVDDRKRRDLDAIWRRRRCRAKPAFQIGGGRAVAAAGITEREGFRGGRGSDVTEIAVGREPAPGFIATVEKIENDRARHDWNNRAAHDKASALFGEPGLHAATGVKPERRATAERNGIDPLHGIDEIEQRSLAGTWAAAANVERRHRGGIENHCGNAGRQPRVVGMADPDASDIGKQVFQKSSRLARHREER